MSKTYSKNDVAVNMERQRLQTIDDCRKQSGFDGDLSSGLIEIREPSLDSPKKLKTIKTKKMNLEQIKNRQEELNKQLEQLTTENGSLIYYIVGLDNVCAEEINIKDHEQDSLLSGIDKQQNITQSLIHQLTGQHRILSEATYNTHIQTK
jgi:predicted transcriptional regulator